MFNIEVSVSRSGRPFHSFLYKDIINEGYSMWNGRNRVTNTDILLRLNFRNIYFDNPILGNSIGPHIPPDAKRSHATPTGRRPVWLPFHHGTKRPHTTSKKTHKWSPACGRPTMSPGAKRPHTRDGSIKGSHDKYFRRLHPSSYWKHHQPRLKIK